MTADTRVECVCVWDCRDCSLSGEPHTHPDDGSGLYGACPVHPDAAGDK